jgi:hypothetical protein
VSCAFSAASSIRPILDLNIGNFESGAKDLVELLPKETIPIPSSCLSLFNVNGYFKGTINNFSTDLLFS